MIPRSRLVASRAAHWNEWTVLLMNNNAQKKSAYVQLMSYYISVNVALKVLMHQKI